MKSFLLSAALMAVLSVTAVAQAPCNEPAVELMGSSYNNPEYLFSASAPIPTIVFTNPSSVLTNVEFLIVDKSYYGADGLVNPIVGVTANPSFVPQEVGISDCKDFTVTAISYNLSQLQSVVDAILTQNYAPGISCCMATQMFSLDVCGQFNSAGIYSGSDVTSIGDLFSLVGILTGGTALTVDGAMMALDMLNGFLPSFGDCAGAAANGICYAMDTTVTNYYTIQGGGVIEMQTVDTLRVEYPMTLNSYAVPPLASYVGPDGAPCANDFIYTSFNPSIVEIVTPSGDFIVHGRGTVQIEVCTRHRAVPLCDIITVVIDSVVAVNEVIMQDFQAKVFPNPTKHNLQIQMEVKTDFMPCQMRLVDLAGRIIWAQTYEFSAGSVQENINMEDLPQGLYILQVNNAHHHWQEKIIKY